MTLKELVNQVVGSDNVKSSALDDQIAVLSPGGNIKLLEPDQVSVIETKKGNVIIIQLQTANFGEN